MFKKVVQFEANHVVKNRYGGLHAKRDPLLDEKVGSQKKRVADDRLYKETDDDKMARIGAREAEKEAAKKARKEQRKSVQSALSSFKDKLKATSLPSELSAEAEMAEKKHKEDKDAKVAKALEKREATGQATLKFTEAGVVKTSQIINVVHDEDGTFSLPSSGDAKFTSEEVSTVFGTKTFLKSANGSFIAVKAGKGLVESDEPALEVVFHAAASSVAPDAEKKLTFNEIWKEGEGEAEEDWLGGKGLKFHTTADKAFAMDSKKFKEATQTSDSSENREAAAAQAKKQGEMKMEEFRRSKKA